ncbi:hypothetical protein BGZ57DRAFT_130946 [Hyaloscypha finlandica]|nr:hypothetical protein BGZ57DRAFT_130946 [Hyaloscypha finlandica]
MNRSSLKLQPFFFPLFLGYLRCCNPRQHCRTTAPAPKMSLQYSLGDFIAGANMTYRLIRALSETKGACMEYQEAMSELGALQQTFLQVGYLRPSHTLSQATINAAAYIVLSSVELIGEFLRKTQKYRQRFTRAGPGNAVSDSWQKMGWVLFKREELKALKDALHLRLTNIGVLLSTAQIHSKIPLIVTQFEDKNSVRPSYSEGHATEGTDIGVSVTNDHK